MVSQAWNILQRHLVVVDVEAIVLAITRMEKGAVHVMVQNNIITMRSVHVIFCTDRLF